MVVTRSEAKQQKEIHVVTGGGGFPGFTLGKKLAQNGHQVRLLDIAEPVWELEDGMEFIKGSVVDKTIVAEAIEGASVVYHMASYGMSGKSQNFSLEQDSLSRKFPEDAKADNLGLRTARIRFMTC
ncbi:short chain dehydrogenase/reductase family 42E member 1 [Elysia marginata]|uniref:Short chain dehydrogenase/reductase family 42E member 1 n=1 Tax=Elysia marginata TaxID=1093978 RepID=A0AAV4GGH6_9GAST|nr:short chain dehydrogenase/reductase family 42E member 1 [Elysia marginata]